MIRSAASADEKRAAIAARDALRAAILGELVTLTVHSFDKYGRLLADVYYTEPNPNPESTLLPRTKYGTNLAEALLTEGLAVPYDGKTKAQPDWEAVFQDAKLAREEAAATTTPPATPPATPATPSTPTNSEAALETPRATLTKPEPATDQEPKSDNSPATESK